MVSAATPLVLQAVYEQAQTLFPDVLVCVGYPDSNSPATTILAIGVDDVFSRSTANGSSSEQRVATMGTNRTREDDGTVTCCAAVQRGDMDQFQALLDVYADVIDPLGVWLRATPGLGLSLSYCVAEIRNDRFELDSNTESVLALVYFDIAFRARI